MFLSLMTPILVQAFKRKRPIDQKLPAEEVLCAAENYTVINNITYLCLGGVKIPLKANLLTASTPTLFLLLLPVSYTSQGWRQ